MRSSGFRNIAIISALGFAFLVAGTLDAAAQYRWDNDRERQRVEQQRRANQNWQREQDRQRRSRDYRRDNVYNGRYGSAAVNQGYQQGLIAGQTDRRKGKYNRSNVYRNTGSYPNAGDPSSADYQYRQGYLQGYEDGYYGRNRY